MSDTDDGRAPSIPPAPPLPSFASSIGSEVTNQSGQSNKKPDLPLLRVSPQIATVSEEFDSPPKTYRSEFTMPINSPKADSIRTTVQPDIPRQRVPSTLQEPQPHRVTTSEHDFHVDIRSKLDFFEAEIEKENEGVRRNRKQIADLSRNREKTWKKGRHGKYFQGNFCGCPTCSGAKGKKNGSGQPGNLPSTGENVVESSSSEKPRIESAKPKMEQNRVESASNDKTRTESWTPQKYRTENSSTENRTGSIDKSSPRSFAGSDRFGSTDKSLPRSFDRSNRIDSSDGGFTGSDRNQQPGGGSFRSSVTAEDISPSASLTAAAVTSQALILSKESPIQEIEDGASFRRELTAAGKSLVIIKFYTPWCLPCQKMGKLFQQLAISYPDVKFYRIDIDNEQMQLILEEVDVEHIPSFYFFKNATQVAKFEGEGKKSDLEQLITKYK